MLLLKNQYLSHKYSVLYLFILVHSFIENVFFDLISKYYILLILVKGYFKMNMKKIIALALLGTSLNSLATSPDVNGNGMNHLDLEKVYTIEEGDSFGFYIGIPASLPYRDGFEYKTVIIEKDDGISLEMDEYNIFGKAPEVDIKTTFRFSTETETDLKAPNDFIVRKFKVIVLNK